MLSRSIKIQIVTVEQRKRRHKDATEKDNYHNVKIIKFNGQFIIMWEVMIIDVRTPLVLDEATKKHNQTWYG